MTLDGIGLFFQRNQTWFEESKGMVDYVTECQRRLQSGYSVSDILVFTGEEIPSRSILPDRLVNILPGLIGTKRYLKEKERMENTGQPMAENPVGVSHSANIATPQEWVNPLCGYKYDCVNKDALLRLAKLDGNSIVMPCGNRYRVLVLPPPHPMNPSLITLSKEIASKVEEFRKAGVIILDVPYTDSDLSSLGIERDVEVPEDIAWTHRHDNNGEMYFLSNQQSVERSINVSFRKGNYTTVRIYDPVNKRYLKPNVKSINNPRTLITLTLPAYGSIFVELDNDKKAIDEYTPQFTENISLDGEWDIFFKETDQHHHVNGLFDWSLSSDDKIKYYSGKAIYTTTCNIFATIIITKAILEVGEIHDLAHVRVNDIDCGYVWTPPYEVDISHAIKESENKIEIEVVNTWANALRGADTGHPPYDGIWTNAKYRMKTPELLPAGLLGPVVIKINKNDKEPE